MRRTCPYLPTGGRAPRALTGLIALVACCISSPTLAQFGNPGFMTPDSSAPRPAAGVPNPSDRLFLLLIGQGELAEMELARVAEGKARAMQVKEFAQRMRRDHGQAQQRLAEAAREAALTPPTTPAPQQRAQQEQLAALGDGAQFEIAYLRNQLVEHQKAAQLLAWQINAGQIPSLQRFAAATLPGVLEHLEHVQQLLGELTGAARRDLPVTVRPG
jgi:putative membrane protein